MNRSVAPIRGSELLLTLGLLVGLSGSATAQQAMPVSRVDRTASPAHPLDPALAMARESLDHMQREIHDYQALFVKRCRVDGELPALQFADLKIRNPRPQHGVPMSVYLNFLKPASVKGREVIWVEGRNNNKMIAHESGFANFVSLNLDPNGYLAMRGQRHPITDIGIENLLKKIIETGERDRKYGECNVEFFNDAKIGDHDCTMIQVIHPTRRPYFDFYRARIYFSESLRIPIRYASWSWPVTAGGEPVLEEEYNYLRIEPNVGLTDHDFDSTNPNYRFP